MQTSLKKMVSVAGAASALLFASHSANALLITNWTFDVTTEFVTAGPDAPTFSPAGPVVVPGSLTGGLGAVTGNTTVSSDLLSWGADGASFTQSNGSAFLNRSAIEIVDGNVSGTVETDGAAEQTSTIIHWNQPIATQFPTLTNATIFTSLTLTPQTPAGPALPTLTRTIPFQFIETANSAPCGFPSAGTCDDLFIIDFGGFSDTFDIGGTLYTTKLTAAGLEFLDEDSCAVLGFAAGCAGLQTRETAENDVSFFLEIDTVPVPAPATLGLLGLGLLGLGAARRRR